MTGEKISWERDGSEMVLIPAGSFEMGNHHFNEESTDAQPVHTVDVDEFYMDVTEMTNAQYEVFVPHTGVENTAVYWTQSTCPVGLQSTGGRISWYEATAYGKWAGKRLFTHRSGVGICGPWRIDR